MRKNVSYLTAGQGSGVCAMFLGLTAAPLLSRVQILDIVAAVSTVIAACTCKLSPGRKTSKQYFSRGSTDD